MRPGLPSLSPHTSPDGAPIQRARLYRAAGAMAVIAALGSTAVFAQNNPNTFSLPAATPTPTPTPEVQGPEDERSGVPLPARRIAPERVLPEATPTAPAPSPSALSPPAPAPTTTATPPPPSPPPSPSPASSATTHNATPRSASPLGVPSPAPSLVPDLDFPSDLHDESRVPLPLDEAESLDLSGEPVGDGEWIDVEPSAVEDLGSPAGTLPDATRRYTPPRHSLTAWIWGGLAFALAALVFVAWRAWRARPKAPLPLESALTDAMRSHLSQSDTPKQSGAKVSPRSTDQADAFTPASLTSTPARLDLVLNVSSATRSVMMFTLNFRLTLHNRTDHAVRDLSLWGHLTCAQRGDCDAETFAKGAPIGVMERIGPQQGHTIEASVQLPMVQIKAIRQGNVPMFVPLLHITLESPEVGARAARFVIGTPSQSNATRVHPITLEGAPGAIRGLRAHEIKPCVTDASG